MTMTSRFKHLLFVILPIMYVFYIIWSRVHSRNIFDLTTKTITDNYMIYIVLLFFALLRLYFQLKQCNIIPTVAIKNKILIKVLKKALPLVDNWNEMWATFQQYILRKFFFLNFIILKLLKKLFTWQLYFRYVIIIFDLLPKVIVIILFLLDILLFKQFHYFYYGLSLLLFPLILNTLEKIIVRFHYDNASTIVDKVIILEVDEVNDKVYAEFKPSFKPPYFIKDIVDYMENHYFPVVSFADFAMNYAIARNSIYYDYICVIITLGYIFGWCNILLMI